MFNRARENYQKQLSNINKRNIKKSSPILVKQNNNRGINPNNNNNNKINLISNNNININNNTKI
jgi:hypothetical protein